MYLKLATTLVIGALLAPAAGYTADKTITQSAKDEVTESSVTLKIKGEFAKDKTVSATNIKVDTEEGGVVTLSGNARSKAEADQAVKIARDTSGVVSVRNNIVLSDDAGKTARDNKTDSKPDAKKELAKETGGKEIAREAVSDATISGRINAEFAKDKLVSATSIKVDSEESGVISLGGQAKAKAEADQAIKLARDTSGVISVKNNIVIADSGKDSPKKSGTDSVKEDVKDVAITAKIKAEFVKDKTVSAAAIKVETDDNGVVTLKGNAKSKAEAEQAVKLARNTKGVTLVRNEISVPSR